MDLALHLALLPELNLALHLELKQDKKLLHAWL